MFSIDKTAHYLRSWKIFCADLVPCPTAAVEQHRVGASLPFLLLFDAFQTSSAPLVPQYRRYLLVGQLLVAADLLDRFRRSQFCVAHGGVLPAGASEIGDCEGRPLSAAVYLNQQVLGLDISVNNVEPVDVLQPAEKLQRLTFSACEV